MNKHKFCNFLLQKRSYYAIFVIDMVNTVSRFIFLKIKTWLCHFLEKWMNLLICLFVCLFIILRDVLFLTNSCTKYRKYKIFYTIFFSQITAPSGVSWLINKWLIRLRQLPVYTNFLWAWMMWYSRRAACNAMWSVDFSIWYWLSLWACWGSGKRGLFGWV